jgi:hypothetical protein
MTETEAEKSKLPKPDKWSIAYLRTLYPDNHERCKNCGHEFVYHERRIRTKLCDYNSKNHRTCGCKEFVPISKAVQVGKKRKVKSRTVGKRKKKLKRDSRA